MKDRDHAFMRLLVSLKMRAEGLGISTVTLAQDNLRELIKLDVMTISQVADLLKIHEEDVLAAIEDRSLKAEKLGQGYRIGKEAVIEFLRS